ncbi:hypothetical protein P168DRAFT_346371 [Aspergillus campestris IBT 28561]|uniref:Uncharacterized protein n=1 Tax=Aspergillus campestris (strain IBT 28561) TaxID=1392248 RepID=A0A2I1CY89_ASPC2|nr:uncharacterized protein P168DRAFT_346371 [Aspergillus campestris IBT 28561]PKY02599.1 hypothetical protein P168DRAFT_346371 [Aspergillus campestris IBT 28561]
MPIYGGSKKGKKKNKGKKGGKKNNKKITNALTPLNQPSGQGQVDRDGAESEHSSSTGTFYTAKEYQDDDLAERMALLNQPVEQEFTLPLGIPGPASEHSSSTATFYTAKEYQDDDDTTERVDPQNQTVEQELTLPVRAKEPETPPNEPAREATATPTQALTPQSAKATPPSGTWSNAPGSRGTASTVITPGPALNSRKKKKKKKKTGSQGTTSQSTVTGSSSDVIAGHAHPDPVPTAILANELAPEHKPKNFVWDLTKHVFICAAPDCSERCHTWAPTTAICPRCGPYSEIRYCSTQHLLQDIKRHWVSHCLHYTFEHPCRPDSLPPALAEAVPLIPCAHMYDMPERHRQAVYFNANSARGDYFIFSDYDDLRDAGTILDDDLDTRIRLRCSSRVIFTVTIQDADLKDRFRRILAACLFKTITVVVVTDYLYRLIRDNLRAHTPKLTKSQLAHLEAAVTYQFAQEFSTTLNEQLVGRRHACETDWTGRNRRFCRDATCRAEDRRLLGRHHGAGHKHTVEGLESSYWILRVARKTLPPAAQGHAHAFEVGAKARMRGEGFPDVVPEDRRVFRRGEGWDGAGSGELEIEGVNDYDFPIEVPADVFAMGEMDWE